MWGSEFSSTTAHKYSQPSVSYFTPQIFNNVTKSKNHIHTFKNLPLDKKKKLRRL
jgi:hypothetical protein